MQSLLDAIVASPEDALPRLVYADWLEEDGNAEAASAIRKACKDSAEKYWSRTTLDVLLGHRIQSVSVVNDATIELVTDKGPIRFDVTGDCCSESWFYRVRGLNKVIGQPVIAIIDTDVSDIDPNDGLCRQDSDEVNGIGLLTPGGTLEIVYRNSSNGYYGGSIEASKTERATTDIICPVDGDWTYKPTLPVHV